MQAPGQWDTLSKPSAPRARAARPWQQLSKPSAASADALLAAIIKQHRLPREWNELQHWSAQIGLQSSLQMRREVWQLCKQQRQAQQPQPAAVAAQEPSKPSPSTDAAAPSASSSNASRSRSHQASTDSSSTEPDTILLAAMADMWPLMAAAMPAPATISPDSTTSSEPSSTSSVRRRTRRPQKQQPVARAARAAAVALSAVMTVLAPETAAVETATAATAAVFSNPLLSWLLQPKNRVGMSPADHVSNTASSDSSSSSSLVLNFSIGDDSSSVKLFDPTAALKTLPAAPIDTTTTSSSSSSSALIPGSTISRLGPTRVIKPTSKHQAQVVRVLREAVRNNTAGLFDDFGDWESFQPNMVLPEAFCVYEVRPRSSAVTH